MPFCPSCGNEYYGINNFCSKCGVKINNPLLDSKLVPNSNKSWLITFFLCWILGFLGIHRFYTRHIKSGLLQLFTIGGFGFWTAIDWILILTNNFKDKKGNKIVIKSGEGKKAWIISLSIFLPLFLAALIISIIIPLNKQIKSSPISFSKTDSIKSNLMSDSLDADKSTEKSQKITLQMPVISSEELDPDDMCHKGMGCNCDENLKTVIVVRGITNEPYNKYTILDDGNSTSKYYIDDSNLSNAAKSWLPYYFEKGRIIKIKGSYCGSGGIATIIYISKAD